jgi:hypothetical protein
MGDEELVAIERPFHIMNAVERTSAKLRTCAIDCRAFDRLREESIFDADVKGKFLSLAIMAGRSLESDRFRWSAKAWQQTFELDSHEL